jgi:hypothetical protein
MDGHWWLVGTVVGRGNEHLLGREAPVLHTLQFHGRPGTTRCQRRASCWQFRRSLLRAGVTCHAAWSVCKPRLVEAFSPPFWWSRVTCLYSATSLANGCYKEQTNLLGVCWSYNRTYPIYRNSRPRVGSDQVTNNACGNNQTNLNRLRSLTPPLNRDLVGREQVEIGSEVLKPLLVESFCESISKLIISRNKPDIE